MDLTICVSYYDAPDYLRRCLASLRAHPPRRAHEVLIVDDASRTPAETVAAPPGSRFVRTPVNVGYARANNTGIRASAGRYILILNCDTEVYPGALETLAEYLDGHPGVGAVGPMLLNGDGSVQLQGRRGRLTPLTGIAYALGLDRRFPRHRLLAGYLMRYADPFEPVEAEALSGACMMVRAEVLHRVGGFDEALIQYAEDLDLCYRIGAAGWRVMYLPQAQVRHFGGQGGTQVRFLRSLYLYHRSLWMLFARYSGPLFPLYGWAVALLLAARLGAVALHSLWVRRLVGTPKGKAIARSARHSAEP